MIRCMEVIEVSSDAVSVRFSPDEIRILSSSLNEILHGPHAIEAWEFQTRVGVTRDEASSLLRSVQDLLSA